MNYKYVHFLIQEKIGIFATRAPRRQNAIGLSIVKIIKIENKSIEVEYIDMLNETSILVLKHYITLFDEITTEKEGWFSRVILSENTFKSDDRF